MDNTQQSPTCVTFCYGIGGLDEGLERVVGPLRNLCIVEIESVAIANLVAKMEEGQMAPCPIWSNVKTFPAYIFRGRVDWLLGGYPCTPFSLAGKRRGTQDPRHLWPYFERAIKTIRPVCCLFENVDDHLTLGFSEVYCSLRAMGYTVEVGVYSAEETGAPHERLRMFILAMENSFDRSVWNKDRAFGRFTRISNVRQGNRKKRSIWSNTTSELEHSNRQRFGEERKCQEWPYQPDKLVNAAIISKRKSPDQTITIAEEKSAWEESGERCKLGNTNIPRLQGWGSKFCEECTSQWTFGSNGPFDPKWPSRPGEPQQSWEHRRTTITKQAARLLSGYGKKYPEGFSKEQLEQVAFDDFTSPIKSPLGLSTYGYKFREDFLRALGNMVVPATAEIAIRDLLKKHEL